MKRVLFFTLFVGLLFMGVFMIPTSAEHTTCSTNGDNCEEPIDWKHWFNNLEYNGQNLGESPIQRSINDVNLSDSTDVQEYFQSTTELSDTQKARLLYSQVHILRWNDYESERLRGEDNILGLFRYSNTGTVNEDSISGPNIGPTIIPESGGVSINSGTKETYQYQLVEDYIFELPFRDEPDTSLRPLDIGVFELTKAQIPENTNITIKLYDTQEMSGDPLFEKTVSNINQRVTGSTSNEDSLLVPVRIPENARTYDEYGVEVVLQRENTDVESPSVDLVNLHEVPRHYRKRVSPLNNYDQIISDLNEQMYESYNPSSDIEDSTAPRITKERFKSTNGSLRSRFYNSGETIFRNGYVKIDQIEPSVKVPNESATVGQDWVLKGNQSGEIHAIYDISHHDTPEDYNTGFSVGSMKYEYSRQGGSDGFNITAHIQDIDNSSRTELAQVDRTDSGSISFAYDPSDIPATADDGVVFHTNVHFEVTVEEDVYERVCDEYDDEGDCISSSWEYRETNTHTYEQSMEDERKMEFAENPDSSAYDMKTVDFPDEQWIHLERNPNTLSETRWVSMSLNGTTYTDSVNFENRGVYSERYAVLDSFADNVSIDVWTKGNHDNQNLDLYIDNELVQTFTPTNTSSLAKRTGDAIEYELGESQENINIRLESDTGSSITSANNSPMVYYKITSNEGNIEEQREIHSRWSYLTFRDTRWDAEYEYVGYCEGDSGCYDYIDHGIPPSQNDGFWGFFGDSSAENINFIYPTATKPVQAHLLPVNNHAENNPGIDIQGVDETFITEGKVEVKPQNKTVDQEIHTPIISNECAKYTPLADNPRVCGVFNITLANESIENTLDTYLSDYESNESYEDIEIGNPTINDITSDEVPTIERPITAEPIYNEGTYNYQQQYMYNITTYNGADNLQIDGNTTWNDPTVVQPESEYIGRNTEMTVRKVAQENINNIDPLPQQSTDISNRENASVYMINLQTDNGAPIATNQRDVANEQITVRNTETDSIMYSNLETNDYGRAYITVSHTDTERVPIQAEFETTTKWWTLDSNKLVLTNDSARFTSTERPDPEFDGFFTILFTFIFVLTAIFYAIAKISTVVTNESVTVRKLYSIALSPLNFWAKIFLALGLILMFILF